MVSPLDSTASKISHARVFCPNVCACASVRVIYFSGSLVR